MRSNCPPYYVVEFNIAANLNGKVSFELTVTDGTENYIDLVEVIVNPVNDILIANDDTVTTDEDTPLTISATELLGNDINTGLLKKAVIFSLLAVLFPIPNSG